MPYIVLQTFGHPDITENPHVIETQNADKKTITQSQTHVITPQEPTSQRQEFQ
jgi:hypothetical protein